MEYSEYFKRKAMASIYQIFGSLVLFFGFIAMFANGAFGLIILIAGIGLIAYGKYQMNKLRFDRENTGYRVYHQNGRY